MKIFEGNFIYQTYERKLETPFRLFINCRTVNEI